MTDERPEPKDYLAELALGWAVGSGPHVWTLPRLTAVDGVLRWECRWCGIPFAEELRGQGCPEFPADVAWLNG